MNGIVLKRDPARRDIVACYLYLADRSPAAADRFLEAVEQAFARMSAQPGLGEPCQFRDPQFAAIRRAVIAGFRNYLIYYQAIDGGIEVLRVVHAARDQSSVLDEPAPDRGDDRPMALD